MAKNGTLPSRPLLRRTSLTKTQRPPSTTAFPSSTATQPAETLLLPSSTSTMELTKIIRISSMPRLTSRVRLPLLDMAESSEVSKSSVHKSLVSLVFLFTATLAMMVRELKSTDISLTRRVLHGTQVPFSVEVLSS